MIVPVILAGGVGSRLWPLSREQFPKQCIQLVSPEHSLFQDTVNRFASLPDVTSPVIVCGEEHRFLMAQQLHDIGVAGRIILEPSGKNTAPAIALAAHWVAEEFGPDAIMLVAPADHVFTDPSGLLRAVTSAVKRAEQGGIVTLGVKPDRPETGYGYIKVRDDADTQGCMSIDEFKEKPDAATAQAYLDSGQYLWNAGLFVVSPKAYLSALVQHAEAIHQTTAQAFAGRTTDLDFIRINVESWAQCPADSIDYAVMERIDNGYVQPLGAGWSDVGSWASLKEVLPHDANNNVTHGDVLLRNTRNSYVHAETVLTAVVGMDDVVVVQTDDAILVSHTDDTQDVKHIVETLKKQHRTEYEKHLTLYRPWGWFKRITQGDRHIVNKIMVKPGHRIGAQKHMHRAEHWVVVRGTAKLIGEHDTKLITENESAFIPVGQIHSLENPGKMPLELIEIQTGSYLGEDDIIRVPL
ncbi:MAG: mannose-1-phosphate guanylyltransferase/mannose-6-phosphate isomerase [Natronospirillum sp.]